jgi:hypothetical protein
MVRPIKFLDYKLGEVFFRNNSAFSGNIGGRLNMAICRFFCPTDKELEDEGKGFTEIGKINEKQVQKIEKEFQKCVDQGETDVYEENGRIVKEAYNTMKDDFADRFSELENVVNDLRPEIESFYGSYFEPVYINIIRYREGEKTDYNTRSWHLDEYSPDHIRLFILLTDVKESGGTSCFITREDTEKAVKDVEGNFKQNTEFWSQWDKNRFYGEKGSAAIANPTMNFHRGENPEDYRDMVIITFRPALNSMEENWLHETGYISSERELLKLNSLLNTLKCLKSKII